MKRVLPLVGIVLFAVAGAARAGDPWGVLDGNGLLQKQDLLEKGTAADTGKTGTKDRAGTGAKAGKKGGAGTPPKTGAGARDKAGGFAAPPVPPAKGAGGTVVPRYLHSVPPQWKKQPPAGTGGKKGGASVGDPVKTLGVKVDEQKGPPLQTESGGVYDEFIPDQEAGEWTAPEGDMPPGEGQPYGPGPSPSTPDGGLLSGALPPPPPAPAKEEAAGDGPVEPREILLASGSVEEARQAQQIMAGSGYRLRSRRVLEGLGMVLSVFRAPQGVDVRDVVRQMQEQSPDTWLDANHRYRPLAAGQAADAVRYARALVGWRTTAGCGQGMELGLADGPLDATHPAFAGRAVEVARLLRRREEAAGPAHATAIAALLVGAPGSGFEGLLPAARLRLAVVLRRRGEGIADTTAEHMIRALDHFARHGVGVAVLSLGGPPNRLLELGTWLAARRGMLLVAAAGNGGPEATPVYPAAYEHVTGVTAVDADGRLYPRATPGAHVAVAAPGVDLWSAAPGGGGGYFSGTSYATPFVAAALARLRAAGRTDPLRDLLERARDLGPAGPDPRFGRGLLRDPGCSGAAVNRRPPAHGS